MIVVKKCIKPEVENIMPRKPRDLGIIQIDPYLLPYEKAIRARLAKHAAVRRKLLPGGGRLREFANGYLYYGVHRTPTGWVYREWAPKARALHLIGDFNGWNRISHPLKKLENGAWEIVLPGMKALSHGQHVLVEVEDCNGVKRDRIPLCIQRIVRPEGSERFVGEVWEPEKPFLWTDSDYSPVRATPLLVYEAHIGMATEKGGVGTYAEFTRDVLPRIARAGYNVIQLMGIMEHPYYASFGYQVTNFFAASSWFGTPDELKTLINTAHEMGIAVLLDLVHSHASGNYDEGIAEFDGTATQFFREGQAGYHEAWGSRVFDYGNPSVLHFLLSSIKYWMMEYHFDGFRFDGVTSMLYFDHGLGRAFTTYEDYFGPNADMDAAIYLMLANELTHSIKHNAITIAEDVSGMPGLCLPVREGGFGFGYRLNMGVPDFWIEMLERRDEDWDLGRMWHELTTRRPQEPVVGYSESHDQALVGDKTLIFRLADAAMYTDMDKATHTAVIDRAIALIKMIRLITISLACEGYLNFMGNEFGHPEWIDFPREGNGWSYQYARRQWSLRDNGFLKYEWIAAFDEAMLKLFRERKLYDPSTTQLLWIDEAKKIICFRKAGLLFAFNFHPTESRQDTFLPAPVGSKWRTFFTTDESRFGGEDRVDEKYVYTSEPEGDSAGFRVYLPCRTAVVLEGV